MDSLADPNFRALFEESPGLFLVLDPQLTIRAVSNAYLHATMTERDAVIGRPLFEVFPDNPNDLNADGVGNLSASLDRVLRLGKPDAMAMQKYDIRRPDGVFEERYWSPLNTPVFGDDGQLHWIIHRVEDVTALAQLQQGQAERDAVARSQQLIIDQLRDANEALTRSEAALMESQSSLRETQAIAKIGSWRRRLGCSELEWSDEVFALFGLPLDGPQPTTDAFRAALTPEGRATVTAVLDADPPPETFNFTLKVRRPDGSERVCWLEGHTEFDASGRPLSFVGVCQDVTEREAAAAQLHQAQKMESVGQLTGGLAHDFNNLLAVIIGNLDLVADDLAPETSAREFAETALQAALKGSELTRQLLAFSRRQPLDPMVLDLNELVAGIDPLWRRTLGEAVTVNLVLDEDLWHARVDRSQMESALLNLVINARDAMPNGGTLTVETSNATLDDTDPDLKPGDYAMIAVSDTGEGMTPDVLGRVFEPFFTTKGVGEGTGLGLSMVYGFAKQSEGQLKLYSEAGHGTTVRIYLPRADSADADEVLRAEPESIMGRGERVLVVEDNPGVRRIAVRQLTDLGYEVVEADSGPAGLAAIRADPAIDLVFTDIIMPGGVTGIGMVEAARRARPGLRVLFTTGFASASALGGRHLTGAYPLISKPYRRADLAAKLREALAE
jgi:signal transduction histidine kinase/ActR/RegA family two-component response regulator